MDDNSFIIPLSQPVIQEKTTQLKAILKLLSSRIDVEDQYLTLKEQFEELYSGGYRHMYSEVGFELSQMDFSAKETLSQNIEEFRKLLCADDSSSQPGSIYGSVLKLSDHINLENQRSTQLKEYMDNEEVLGQKIGELEDKLTKTKKKMKRMEVQNTNTLAIFASIVVAITSGIVILNNNVGSLKDLSPSNQLFIVSLSAFIIFNVVFIMLVYVRSMINELHQDEASLKDSVIRNIPIILVDVILLVMIVISYLQIM